MGLVDRLKEILFDEEQIEVPVTVKEETPKKTKVIPDEEEDEVIIKQIKSTPKEEDDLFDMPKLKKDEPREEVRTTSFTFPVFEDDETEVKAPTRSSYYDRERSYERKETRVEERPRTSEPSSNEYKRSLEPETKKYQEAPKQKKPFSPSPVISPVYGILNENYKKEDIVTRTDTKRRLSSEKIDLDSVRKKAYGTLEDDIESLLDEVAPSKPIIPEVETISSDSSMSAKIIEPKRPKKVAEEPKEVQSTNEEEDLFDLIDSLYESKEN